MTRRQEQRRQDDEAANRVRLDVSRHSIDMSKILGSGGFYGLGDEAHKRLHGRTRPPQSQTEKEFINELVSGLEPF